MTALQEATETCLRSFEAAIDHLSGEQNPAESDDVQEELYRFRVWMENLGGQSALEWRMRDRNSIRSTTLTLLALLQRTLIRITDVRTHSDLRLNSATINSDVSDVISLPSDEGSDVSDIANAETHSLIATATEVVNSLYQLSFKIRSSKTGSFKAKFCEETDTDSGLELLSHHYACFDRDHILGLLQDLRCGSKTFDDDETLLDRLGRNSREVDFSKGSVQVYDLDSNDNTLLTRLSTANTTRRRRFRHWSKHPLRPTESETLVSEPQQSYEAGNRAKMEHEIESGKQSIHVDVEKAICTTLETTNFGTDLNPSIAESPSIDSVATTAFDLDGRIADLPGPPRQALDGLDSVCPYCHVIYPSHNGVGRAWRSHLIHDLEPYVCTYVDCAFGDLLYGSRGDWIDHEDRQHRSIWRCTFHADQQFASEAVLRDHLQQDHTMTSAHIDVFARISRFSRHDDRSKCPICLHDAKDIPDFTSHLANHLERIAIFSLPRNVDPEGGGSEMSNIAAPQSMSNSNSWLSGTMNHSLNSPVAGPLNDLEVDALTSIGHALTAQVPRSPSPPTAPEYEDEDDYSSIPVPRGTTCKRKGCGMTYTGDPRAENQPCLHHPGAPTFHNGNKGWSCCERRVWIFDEFLSIPGCKTSARHMFGGTKSKLPERQPKLPALYLPQIEVYQNHTSACHSFPWKRQESIQPLDFQSRNVVPIIHARMEKGAFESADRIWTTYRRYYLSISCSLELNPHVDIARLCLNGQPIKGMGWRLAATSGAPGGGNWGLVQPTSRRDEGPEEIITIVTFSATPNSAPTDSQPPMQNFSSVPSAPSASATHKTEHTFDRVQFKKIGAREKYRQYAHLMVELWADVRGDGIQEPKWIKVTQVTSERLEIRGRSPGHYNKGQDTRQVNSNTNVRGSGASLYQLVTRDPSTTLTPSALEEVGNISAEVAGIEGIRLWRESAAMI